MQIVDVKTKQEQEIFRTRGSAHYLYKIALVPHQSSISQSYLLFFNILFDENVSKYFREDCL